LVSIAPTTVIENVPPHDIAGTDGNHGERGPVTGAIDVDVAKDVVGGNTEGGYVEYGGGRVGPSNPV
jgi:hypothetical protein